MALEYASDEDVDDGPMPASRTGYGRKLAQNAAFLEWVAQEATKEPPSTDLYSRSRLLGPNDELQTAAQLANTSQGEGIIHKARGYQTELFQLATRQNVIAVLDTGSGKTLIAVMLVKHVLDQEYLDRANGQRRRIAFFLVNSVTLVFQQHAVLANNLANREIGRLCGADGTDLWDSAEWARQFGRYNVIVCTAEVLHQALQHSYFRMSDISLLVFDEAHHCHDNHPYARIIKDSYFPCPSKPRIFGMTASPVNAKTNIVQAVESLETMLNARIATTSNLSLNGHVSRPREVTWEYSQLLSPFETELSRRISATCDIAELKNVLAYTKQAASELGPWCADKIWHFELNKQSAAGLQRKLERNWSKSRKSSGDNGDEIEKAHYAAEIEKVHHAAKIVDELSFEDPVPTLDTISPKVLLLWRMLRNYFERPSDTQCIIFVRQRRTAIVLTELFKHAGIKHLHCDALVGIQHGSIGYMQSSFRRQMLTMQHFRKKELNCLFATSVAEEGLDIPSCNLIIRFDLYQTMIEYMQSRGRARHQNSIYAHMLERDNAVHQDRFEEVRASECVLRDFTSTLKEDRLLDFEPHLQRLRHKERFLKSVVISETGARLTSHSSLLVLEHYASSLQYEDATSCHVVYNLKTEGGMFQYQACLPETSPVASVAGDPYPSKSLAKQSAAFNTCLALRKRGLLDDHWQTTYRRRRPEMANARLAITSKAQHRFPMLTKSAFWKRDHDQSPTTLFVTAITLQSNKCLNKPIASLVLLTRQSLPEMPTFPVFLEGDIETQVVLTAVSEELKVQRDLLDLLTIFTLKMFDDIFHKSFERNDDIMSYWVAPAKSVSDQELPRSADNIVDIGMLQHVAMTERVKWISMMDPKLWTHKFLVDPNSGKYRYLSGDVIPGLGPNSPVPASLPHRRTRMKCLLEYTSSLFPNSRHKFVQRADLEQPVLAAELVGLRLNILNRLAETECEEQLIQYQVCPEALEVSPFPLPLAGACLTLPAILSRVESYLIALEASKHLNLEIPAGLALEALTKDSDNTEEHQQEQIHVQRGMGKNYERLEFLGDAWLKMATSISLFVSHPTSDEYDFHVQRMQMICNKNLYDGAVDEKMCLTRFIRTQGFNRRTWYPEGLRLLRGKEPDFQASHGLAMKSVADVCEAFLGAAYLTARDSKNLDMAVRAVSRLVHHKDHTMTAWSDYSEAYRLPRYQIEPADGIDLHRASSISDRLGHNFRYPRLLRSALTHPSDSWSDVPNYQRLEFLGDALFDMVAIEYIYRSFPDRDPQWMTEHKMAMVSNKFLAAVAVELELDKHLSFDGVHVASQILHYSRQVRDITQGGRETIDKDYWTLIDHPPKCLSDVVEAYIGAIFIDSGLTFSVVEDFFHHHILWHFEDMSLYDTFANAHPTVQYAPMVITRELTRLRRCCTSA